MNTLKLDTKNTAEARILEYLTANASDALAAKINTGTKTLTQAMNYCEAQARKQAAGASSAYVEDATVYGWCVHFFEEEDAAALDATETDDAEADDAQTPAPVVSRKKQESAQAELDLFGGEADDE